MHAIRLTAFGGPDVLELVDIAVPVAGSGQILIRVESAAMVRPGMPSMRSHRRSR